MENKEIEPEIQILNVIGETILYDLWNINRESGMSAEYNNELVSKRIRKLSSELKKVNHNMNEKDISQALINGLTNTINNKNKKDIFQYCKGQDEER